MRNIRLGKDNKEIDILESEQQSDWFTWVKSKILKL